MECAGNVKFSIVLPKVNPVLCSSFMGIPIIANNYVFVIPWTTVFVIP